MFIILYRSDSRFKDDRLYPLIVEDADTMTDALRKFSEVRPSDNTPVAISEGSRHCFREVRPVSTYVLGDVNNAVTLEFKGER